MNLDNLSIQSLTSPKKYGNLGNTGKIPVAVRNDKGQLQPGSNLNPAGKPKGARHMTSLLKEAITKVAEGYDEPADIMIIKSLLKSAMRGSETATKMIFDRLDGQAAQTIVLEDAMSQLTPEQKEKLNKLLKNNE